MVDRTLIQVVQGPNAWRLLRTDRDGASEGEIPQMAAAAVRWAVRGAGQTGAERGPLHELINTGPREWRFGWVRPLRVLSVTHEPAAMSPGRELADRHRLGSGNLVHRMRTVPTVRGQKPWFIGVEFWWRAPDARIEFPAWREGIFGRSYELNGADWVLDRAVAVQRAPDPGDQTWGEATGKRTAEVSSSIAKTVLAGGIGLGVLAVLYLLSRR